MNIKRVMIVGTMIVAMSFGGTAWAKPTVTTAPVAKWSISSVSDKDELLEALNQTSDEELYEALYEGRSLREIAEENEGDIDDVIDLQVKQLTQQFDQQLASGSISQAQYADYTAEIRGIVTASAAASYVF